MNCVLLLAEMSSDQDFSIEYNEVKGKKTNGQTQRWVQISTKPIVVCYGSGNTSHRADYVIARCALEYLKILFDTKIAEQFKAWTQSHASMGKFVRREAPGEH